MTSLLAFIAIVEFSLNFGGVVSCVKYQLPPIKLYCSAALKLLPSSIIDSLLAITGLVLPNCNNLGCFYVIFS